MVENYKKEYIKDYDTIEEAIYDLKEYVKNDVVYEDYKENGINEKINDYEIFCINHINALKKLINEYTKLKKEMEKKEND